MTLYAEPETGPPSVASSGALVVPPLRDIRQYDTVRLIPSGRLKPAVLAPLAATPDAMDDLALLESLSNVRLQASSTGLTGLDPDELVFGRPNDSFVNAAFTHVRPGGNRFNDDRRGAWYCGFDAETSLSEVAWHLTRELDNIGHYHNVTDYAELIADFVGPFHDLTGQDAAIGSYLASEPATAYPAGQALACSLRAAHDSNGLLYQSVRHPGGSCLVAFKPALVQNVRQGGVWRLSWAGDRDPVVTRPPGRWPETVLAPGFRRR